MEQSLNCGWQSRHRQPLSERHFKEKISCKVILHTKNRQPFCRTFFIPLSLADTLTMVPCRSVSDILNSQAPIGDSMPLTHLLRGKGFQLTANRAMSLSRFHPYKKKALTPVTTTNLNELAKWKTRHQNVPPEEKRLPPLRDVFHFTTEDNSLWKDNGDRRVIDGHPANCACQPPHSNTENRPDPVSGIAKHPVSTWAFGMEILHVSRGMLIQCFASVKGAPSKWVYGQVKRVDYRNAKYSMRIPPDPPSSGDDTFDIFDGDADVPYTSYDNDTENLYQFGSPVLRMARSFSDRSIYPFPTPYY